MPVFIWEGKTRQGEVRTGTMEAENADIVSQKLKAQQIQASKIKKKPKEIRLPTLGSGVAGKELVVFTRQFATMIDAGLPLVQCLEILGSQQQNQIFGKIINGVRVDVESGSTLADALAKHPKVFDELFVNLVAAGEVGGILDTILNRLAAYMEKNMKLIRQVKGAMVYPGVVLTVSIGVTAVLLIWVIPVFEKMFKDFGGTLPAPTQLVIDVSNGLRANLLSAIIGLAIFSFLFRAGVRTKTGRLYLDGVMLKAPVFGPLFRKVAVAKFTRTLGTMISSGVPILDALTITAKSAGNKVVENAIMYTRERISEGRTMADPLAETGVFPVMVVQMIAVGESTGQMDSMLQKIADFYEDEVDVAVAALTSLLEPLMMVFLGGLLGGLIVAMYLPIFELAGAIK
ncbi:MAG: type II secretion system F family protein [Deltaproteobacteria bacterium]|nr:type II secretion system F family protein [Deltaproteobacteria bacterium]